MKIRNYITKVVLVHKMTVNSFLPITIFQSVSLQNVVNLGYFACWALEISREYRIKLLQNINFRITQSIFKVCGNKQMYFTEIDISVLPIMSLSDKVVIYVSLSYMLILYFIDNLSQNINKCTIFQALFCRHLLFHNIS